MWLGRESCEMAGERDKGSLVALGKGGGVSLSLEEEGALLSLSSSHLAFPNNAGTNQFRARALLTRYYLILNKYGDNFLWFVSQREGR